MRPAYALLITAALCARASAEPSIGVVVGADEPVRAHTEAAVKVWLGHHELATATAPLGKGKDGTNTLINCLVISDMRCARSVIEARATASSVVAIVEQVSGKRERTIQVSAYWISKQHDVVSLQRTCDKCTDTVLASTIDAMMMDLAHLAPSMMGHVRITSNEPGVGAMIDNQPIGTTPAEHEVAFGPHTIAVTRDGHIVGERTVDVAPLATVDVAVPVRVEPTPPPVVIRPVEQRSRFVPFAVLGVGVAAIVTGAVLYETGGPTGADFMYRDTRPAGIAVGAGGVVLALVGTILLVRHGHASAPEVAITPTGATVGWAGSF